MGLPVMYCILRRVANGSSSPSIPKLRGESEGFQGISEGDEKPPEEWAGEESTLKESKGGPFVIDATTDLGSLEDCY